MVRCILANLTRQQVGDVLRSVNFNETEAAGLFSWFEYPSRRWHPDKVIARIQFYEARSEMDTWLYVPSSSISLGEREAEYVFYEQNVRTLAESLLRRRLVTIATLALGQGKVREDLRALMIEAPRDPGAGRVLHDWLLDNGIDPS